MAKKTSETEYILQREPNAIYDIDQVFSPSLDRRTAELK